jgi:alkylation response protein AidB-like acyl-CoA dehydrogenase
MGTTSSTLDHPSRTAAVIGTEDEALTIIRTLADVLGGAASVPGTAELRLELLSRSGLLGISVPTDNGGIDVSNTVLATVCCEAAARSAPLAEILAAHFVGLEWLRSHGTEGQQKTVFAAALAGARVARGAARSGEALPLVSNGVALRLGGEVLCTPCARHADWMLLPVQTGGRAVKLVLPVRSEGVHFVANTCEPAPGAAQAAEHVLLKDVAAEPDFLLQATGDAASVGVPRSLGLLLEAACRLGAARGVLERLLDAGDADPLAVGLFTSRLAATEAIIADAGRAIDAAQIGLADQHRINAFQASASALASAQALTYEAVSAGQEPPADVQLTAQAMEVLEQSGRITIDAHRNGAPQDD